MIEHRTTDTDELAPYPNMTGDDLRDFEDWADDMQWEASQVARWWGGALIVILFLSLIIIF